MEGVSAHHTPNVFVFFLNKGKKRISPETCVASSGPGPGSGARDFTFSASRSHGLALGPPGAAKSVRAPPPTLKNLVGSDATQNGPAGSAQGVSSCFHNPSWPLLSSEDLGTRTQDRAGCRDSSPSELQPLGSSGHFPETCHTVGRPQVRGPWGGDQASHCSPQEQPVLGSLQFRTEGTRWCQPGAPTGCGHARE